MEKTEVREEIRKKLFSMQDAAYGDFHSKLMPTVERSKVIGVRVPELRKLAKRLAGSEMAVTFLEDIPHNYYEENNLHAFLLDGTEDYDDAVAYVDAFLPCIDNWATCDGLNPKVFGKNRDKLIGKIDEWMASDHVYTVRFGIGMLMRYYLDEEFRTEYPERVAAVKGEDYYIRMMVAWYFATALAKQYDTVLQYLEEDWLDRWTHNKTIQKAIESYRITAEQKEYLRTLKHKN